MESFLNNIFYPKDLYVDIRIEERCYEFLEIEKKHILNSNFVCDGGAYIRVFDGVCWYEKSTERVENINDIICELSLKAYKNKRMNDIVSQIGLSKDTKISRRTLRDKWNQCEFLNDKNTLLKELSDDMKTVITKKNSKKVFLSNYTSEIYQESSWYGMDIDICVQNHLERHSKVYNSYDLICEKSNLRKQLKAIRMISQQLEQSVECDWMKKVIISPEAMSLIIHEVAGHTSECDLYDSYTSMKNVLKLANEVSQEVNVVDCGGFNQVGGYLYDDEGIRNQKSYIIKNGVFSNVLSDIKHMCAWGVPMTGNGRSISICHEPIVRMSNTYMLPGKKPLFVLLESIKKGILIEHIGCIENNDGCILLKHIRGRIIVDGQIKEPIIIKSYENFWYNFLNAICEISSEAKSYASILSGCDKGGQNGLLVSMGAPYTLLEF